MPNPKSPAASRPTPTPKAPRTVEDAKEHGGADALKPTKRVDELKEHGNEPKSHGYSKGLEGLIENRTKSTTREWRKMDSYIRG